MQAVRLDNIVTIKNLHNKIIDKICTVGSLFKLR
jgi:hypothetical protein